METIVLPGFSLKNKAWAEEVRTILNSRFPTTVANWAHWGTGHAESGWMEQEAEKIVGLIQDEHVNLVAKSIGTAVAMRILESKPDLVDKVILCGVPVRDFEKGDENLYESLRIFREDKILCIQNSDDNHGSYAEVEKFLHSINPRLVVISKPRSDHEYPYTDDFINFLQQGVS